MTDTAPPPSEMLLPDDIRPVVELAGYYAFGHATRHEYRNPAHHLLLIHSGHVTCDTPLGRFNAEGGDLICFRPAERNMYAYDAQTSFHQAVIEFAPPPRHLATPVWDDVGPLPLRLSLGDSFAPMRRVFDALCTELPNVGSLYQLRLRAAVFEMLGLIVEILAGQNRRPPRPKTADPWQRARMMLASQLAGELRIDGLARQMNLSVNHFIRYFKERFGTTPKVYHTRARLREGARMLREGDRPVKSIAYALGFSDSKAFARRFRHHFGVNPSDLRSETPTDLESPAPAMAQKDLMFPVNQHILPPHAGSEYLDRYRTKAKS